MAFALARLYHDVYLAERMFAVEGHIACMEGALHDRNLLLLARVVV